MAKPLHKRIRDEVAAAGWKPKNVTSPLYTYVRDNFEIDILPSINNSYRTVITKYGKSPTTNTMLLDTEQVVNLLRNPVIHY
jgi:hypothetical protein